MSNGPFYCEECGEEMDEDCDLCEDCSFAEENEEDEDCSFAEENEEDEE